MDDRRVQRGRCYRFDFGLPFKERPIIVVSRNTGRDRCLVIPVFERHKVRHPDIVPVSSLSLGLTGELVGVARCDQIFTLMIKRIDTDLYIGDLTDEDMLIIGEGLQAALALK
jgi:mRNA-degrading endonuclease toxin of MazEF toxin-antitoxin module